ncbi:sugar nucleotide-binding protein [candidate division KSB1 bacterium]|nr:sugar nucleotide-binding protein [candidate division KSB1 bacterium]
MKKRLMITGGSGFVGGHLLDQVKSNYDVTATYHTSKYDVPGVHWQHIDLSDSESIKKAVSHSAPDAVVLTAALTSVDECEINRNLAFAVNVQSIDKWIELSNTNNFRVVFVSTDMVYDGEHSFYTEDDPVAPINYYGETKILAEEKLRKSCHNYVIARAALIYGTPLTRSNSFSQGILNRINLKQPVKLFHDQYRSPILVNNLAQALIELCDNSFTGTVNLGGSQRINRYDFGNVMAHIFNFSTDLFQKISMYDIETAAQRPKDVSMDIKKAQSFLKTEFLNIEQGMRISKADLDLDRSFSIIE